MIVFLLTLLVATMALAYFESCLAAGVDIPVSGYIAFCLGALFSILMGVGLTALVFHSTRHGFDEHMQIRRTRIVRNHGLGTVRHNSA